MRVAPATRPPTSPGSTGPRSRGGGIPWPPRPPTAGTAETTVYRYKLPFVIGASAAGTVIEWYDFYLYGVLAAFFATQFFPPGNDVAALLSSLATFGAGFAVRPFGAAFFGRIGDIVGRKFTFLRDDHAHGRRDRPRRRAADVRPDRHPRPDHPRDLLRLAQGLALGGEYGGAAIYVAEHAPDHQRGKYTSWIQTTATVGLLLALVVIALLPAGRWATSRSASTAGGSRSSCSAVLVVLALFIRLRLQETPLFTRLKAEGKSSELARGARASATPATDG